MYMVATPDGGWFKCKEKDDAISLADNLTGDSEEEVNVIDLETGDTIYEAKA